MAEAKRTRTVAVDFDGVIHAYRRGWHDGTIYDDPIPGAIDALAGLQADYAVFVHTTRSPFMVADWLCRQGVHRCVTEDEHYARITTWHLEVDACAAVNEPPTVIGYDEFHKKIEFWNDQTKILVTNRKLPAVAYIDDRGIRFTSWRQTLAVLAESDCAPVTLNPGLDLQAMSVDEHAYRAAGGIG